MYPRAQVGEISAIYIKTIWVFPKIGVPKKIMIFIFLIGFGTITNHPFWGVKSPYFWVSTYLQQCKSNMALYSHWLKRPVRVSTFWGRCLESHDFRCSLRYVIALGQWLLKKQCGSCHIDETYLDILDNRKRKVKCIFCCIVIVQSNTKD